MPLPSDDTPMEVETLSTQSSNRSTSPPSSSSLKAPSTQNNDTKEDVDFLVQPFLTNRGGNSQGSSRDLSSQQSSPSSSTGSYHGDVGMVTEAMIKEEERIKDENDEEREEEEREKVEELSRLKESQRFDRLQHLLEKSSIYSKLLLKKMETERLETKKTNKGRKKRDPLVDKKTVKPQEKETRSSTRKRKLAEETNYKISDYMDSSGHLKKRRKTRQSIGDKEEEGDKTIEQPIQDGGEEEVRYFEGKPIPSAQPKLLTGGILRQYQIEGMEWLNVLYGNGINGILADEMGLGKTIQCIAFIAYLLEMGVKGPFLVVAPLSTIANWVAEFKKFTPSISVYLYHGSISERQILRRKIFRSPKTTPNSPLPVVVTSYEICLKDQYFLANKSWKFMIVDEGHRIKNLNCKLIRTLKTYDAANRLLLTGTPLQNNLAELWSLLNFLIPDVFDDLSSFQSWFDFSSVVDENTSEANEQIIAREKEEHVLSTLHQILTPFLLRRLKSDVELNIPPKREILVYAPLTSLQEKYYTHILNRTIDSLIHSGEIEDGGDNGPELVSSVMEEDNNGYTRRCSTRNVKERVPLVSDKEFERCLSGELSPQFFLKKELEKSEGDTIQPSTSSKSIFNVKMTCVWVMLRKCCNHPYLVEFPLDEEGQPKVDRDLITSSGKLLMLDRMLPALIKQNHKVLIFSQMTQLLDILADFMDLSDLSFARLDGSMSYTDRESEMSRFSTSDDCNVFLLSTRAGGLGINLTAADTVIIFDSDWNPQADLQAQDRCHRIGQTRPVIVYRFVTANTIDQRIVERANGKRRLEKMVIHKGKFKGSNSSINSMLSIDDLTDLLRSVDHAQVVKSNDIISDSALEALLDRSFVHQQPSNNKRLEESSIQHGTVFRVLNNEGRESQEVESSNNSTCNEENIIPLFSSIEGAR